MDKGAQLAYNDPLVPTLRMGRNVLKSVELSPANIENQDCVIILTDHGAYDFKKIVASAKLVIDTRNATKDLHEFKDRIIKLGAGNNVSSTLAYEDEHDVSPADLATH